MNCPLFNEDTAPGLHSLIRGSPSRPIAPFGGGSRRICCVSWSPRARRRLELRLRARLGRFLAAAPRSTTSPCMFTEGAGSGGSLRLRATLVLLLIRELMGLLFPCWRAFGCSSLIGAFFLPFLAFATLIKTEFASGLREVARHGIVRWDGRPHVVQGRCCVRRRCGRRPGSGSSR